MSSECGRHRKRERTRGAEHRIGARELQCRYQRWLRAGRKRPAEKERIVQPIVIAPVARIGRCAVRGGAEGTVVTHLPQSVKVQRAFADFRKTFKGVNAADRVKVVLQQPLPRPS